MIKCENQYIFKHFIYAFIVWMNITNNHEWIWLKGEQQPFYYTLFLLFILFLNSGETVTAEPNRVDSCRALFCRLKKKTLIHICNTDTVASVKVWPASCDLQSDAEHQILSDIQVHVKKITSTPLHALWINGFGRQNGCSRKSASQSSSTKHWWKSWVFTNVGMCGDYSTTAQGKAHNMVFQHNISSSNGRNVHEFRRWSEALKRNWEYDRGFGNRSELYGTEV